MIKNIDFKLLISIISGIVGTGIFFISYSLQNYGINNFIALGLSGMFTIILGYAFSDLKNMSIFEFIENNLGRKVGFMVGLIYWLISCLGNIIVINDLHISISNIFPTLEKYNILSQCIMIIFLTILNCFKTSFLRIFNIIINIFKTVPIILIFVLCLYYKKIDITNLQGSLNHKYIFPSVLKYIWCFSGIELTAIIGKGNSKIKQTIFIAVVIITLLYFINLLTVYGVLGYVIKSPSPIADIFNILFGKNGYLISNIIIFIILLGSANIWINSAGEVGKQNAEIGYFPNFFLKENRYQSPYISVILGSAILLPFTSFNSEIILTTGLNIFSIMVLFFYNIFTLCYFLNKRNIFSIFLYVCILFISIKCY